MLTEGSKIGLAVGVPLSFLVLAVIGYAIWRHVQYERRTRRSTNEMTLSESFQPTPGPDQREWARASLKPSAEMLEPPMSPGERAARAAFFQPHNMDQTVSFLRIGHSARGDTRERLQSVASTLSAHTLQAKPSSNALVSMRADRIGSVDDPTLFQSTFIAPQPSQPSTGSRKTSTSTLAPPSSNAARMSVNEQPRRPSLSVRKVSVGGAEDPMTLPIATKEVIAEGHLASTSSPVDLDERFAKPLSVGTRAPSRIDFTQPFGATLPRQSLLTLPGEHPFSHKTLERNTSLRSDKRQSIEAALPSSKVCSPMGQPTDRSSRHFSGHLLGVSGAQLGTIPHSPVQPRTESDDTQHKRGASTGRMPATTAKRSNSKKKRRPDSIDLAYLRSPKLAAHQTDKLNVPTPSPPPLTAPIDDLKSGIATSVIALKSAGASTNFSYSVPTTPSPKTVQPRTPRTPRTATSEGGHSIMSDLESAQLFQAWRGFRAPTTPDLEVPSVRRALSEHATRPKPNRPKRSTTNDGELSVEVDGSGTVTPTTPTGISRSQVKVDESGSPSAVHCTDKPLLIQPGPATLTPSPKPNRSTSPQPKITYLSEVVKDNERRLSQSSGRLEVG